MKFTSIEMEWTDTGAVVNTSIPLPCPRCGDIVKPDAEHRCGDRTLPRPKTARSSPAFKPSRKPRKKRAS